MGKRQLWIIIILIIGLLLTGLLWNNISKKTLLSDPDETGRDVAGSVNDMFSFDVGTLEDNQDNKYVEEIKNNSNEKITLDANPADEPREVINVDTGHTKKGDTSTSAAINKDEKLTCTLSVTCKSILDNMHKFDMDKLEILPKDGIIYKTQKITFSEGESVFDVLLREMKKNRIHMEFVSTPVYNSDYIEGINNLYEFDCGELSGWGYKVNGQFVNYGCSQYILKDGDVVEWIYTCDLGNDIGEEQSTREGEE